MTEEKVRLQKVLAAAGVASRRAAEQLISQGRVTVNGKPAELGQKVDPQADLVRVDGSRIATNLKKVYFALNKPEGVITTARDPRDRTTVLDLIGVGERVVPVGRLDVATEGLLLLTNDGELVHRLTHPSFEVEKVYVAEVAGVVSRGTLEKLTKQGVRIEAGRPARAVKARTLDTRRGGGGRSVIELTIHEGRKHVVRKMLEEVGHPVRRLTRTAFGPISLGRLKSGDYRALTASEVSSLYRAVGL